ncbi:hypothetical protein BGZ65_010875, partial [Modicella reniformis]
MTLNISKREPEHSVDDEERHPHKRRNTADASVDLEVLSPASSSSPDQVQVDDDLVASLLQRPQYSARFPVEIWVMIGHNLPPSKLASLACLCKDLYVAAAIQPVWENWFDKLVGMGRIKPEELVAFDPSKLHKSAYMLYMCAHSISLCEMCGGSYTNRYKRGPILESPLPVEVPLDTK